MRKYIDEFEYERLVEIAAKRHDRQMLDYWAKPKRRQSEPQSIIEIMCQELNALIIRKLIE
jgi:hypothetical protein